MERVREDGVRVKVDIGVVVRGLVGGGIVEVLDGEVFRFLVLFFESLYCVCWLVFVIINWWINVM